MHASGSYETESGWGGDTSIGYRITRITYIKVAYTDGKTYELGQIMPSDKLLSANLTTIVIGAGQHGQITKATFYASRW